MWTLSSEAAATDPTTTSAEVGESDFVVFLQIVLFPLFSIPSRKQIYIDLIAILRWHQIFIVPNVP